MCRGMLELLRRFGPTLECSGGDMLAHSREEAEEQARRNYRFFRGRRVWTRSVDGYSDRGDTETVCFNPPIAVVVADTDDSTLRNWHDEFLDPEWYVESRDPRLKHLRSLRIFARSYVLKAKP